MWPYWLMFIIPAWAALNETASQSSQQQERFAKVSISATWWCVLAVLTLLVGWRHEVGGDWFNYLENYKNIVFSEHSGFWLESDPGFRMLEWVSWKVGFEVYFVNLMAASMFSLGLIIFCIRMPRPWLALAVSIPYMVLVLGMGYSRQGVALGFVMIALQQSSTRRFLLFVVLGALFHKSAVLVLPIAALASTQNRFLTVFWVTIVVLLSYILLLADSFDNLVVNYIDAEYQSEGTLVRLLMNTVTAVVLLRYRNRFLLSPSQAALWRWMAIISLVLFMLFFVTSASTALDRVALFMLPLQLMVFAHLPEVMGQSNRHNKGWVALVLLYYGIVMFVWLNFATHAIFWIPYRFYPFEGIL